jgi:hypothetical protein
MSSEIATSVPERSGRLRRRASGRHPRALAIQLIGPLTVLAGAMWAVAQPYRITFLDPVGKGLYDFLVQPPLLVVAVGLVYALGIAPGLVEDLEEEEEAEGDGSPS